MSGFKITIRLGITAYSSRDSGQFKLLVDEDGTVPSIRVLGSNSLDYSLEKLSKKYLGYSFDWLTLVLLSANKTDEEVYINYSCMVPLDAPIQNGSWVDFMEIYGNNEGKYIGYEEILSNISKTI